jgi:TRAP-type C4-dicarboxylate transport system substrate-binding protein
LVKRAFIFLIVMVITLMSIGCLISCGAPKAEEPVLLRVSTFSGPTDHVTAGAEAMAARFNERAGGKYVMEVHCAEELVKIGEGLDAVREGVVEIANWPVGLFGGVDKRFSSAEIPFLYNNAYAHGAAHELLLPLYSEILEESFNQKALACFSVGEFQIGGNKPVRTLEDWDGLLVQSVSPVTSDVTEILGGSPVFIPAVEGYQALEKGVIDAALQTTPYWLDWKAYEVASHLTLVYILGATVMASVNLDMYNSLPEDIQAILLEEGLEMGREVGDASLKREEETPNQLAELGMEIYVLDKAERDRWQELIRPYNESLIAGMGEFGQKVVQVADQVNSEYPY